MKIIEWKQSPERHEKIVIKAILRGGKAAIFQVDSNISAYFPKYCIMHVGIKDHAEEEFFCDFRKLAAISRNNTALSDKENDNMAPLLIKNRHDDEDFGSLHIVYSIRRTDNTEKPWLGTNGWQQSRHIYDLTASESVDGANDAELKQRGKPAFRSAMVLASSAVLAACVITVPFVLGSLGTDITKKSDTEKEAQKYIAAAAVTQTKEKSVTDVNSIRDEKPALDRKVKVSTHPKTARKELHKKDVASSRNYESDPAVPCTRDMRDKGIICK